MPLSDDDIYGSSAGVLTDDDIYGPKKQEQFGNPFDMSTERLPLAPLPEDKPLKPEEIADPFDVSNEHLPKITKIWDRGRLVAQGEQGKTFGVEAPRYAVDDTPIGAPEVNRGILDEYHRQSIGPTPEGLEAQARSEQRAYEGDIRRIGEYPIVGPFTAGLAQGGLRLAGLGASVVGASDVAQSAYDTRELLGQAQNGMFGKAIQGLLDLGSSAVLPGGEFALLGSFVDDAHRKGEAAGLKGKDLEIYALTQGGIQAALIPVLGGFGIFGEEAAGIVSAGLKDIAVDTVKGMAKGGAEVFAINIGSAMVDHLAGVDTHDWTQEDWVNAVKDAAAFGVVGGAVGAASRASSGKLRLQARKKGPGGLERTLEPHGGLYGDANLADASPIGIKPIDEHQIDTDVNTPIATPPDEHLVDSRINTLDYIPPPDEHLLDSRINTPENVPPQDEHLLDAQINTPNYTPSPVRPDPQAPIRLGVRDAKRDQLVQIAEAHGIEGAGSMSAGVLRKKLTEAGVTGVTIEKPEAIPVESMNRSQLLDAARRAGIKDPESQTNSSLRSRLNAPKERMGVKRVPEPEAPPPATPAPDATGAVPGLPEPTVAEPTVRDGGPAQEKPVPPPAPETPRPDVRSSEGNENAPITPTPTETASPLEHNQAVKEKGLSMISRALGTTFREVSGPLTQATSDVVDLANRAGLKVVWMRGDDAAKHNISSGFSYKDHVFLNADFSNPDNIKVASYKGGPNLSGNVYLGALLRHEIAHGTGFDLNSKFDPDLIKEATARYAKASGEEMQRHLANDPELARREGIAQLVFEFWTDPKMREEIARRDYTLWQKIKTFLKKYTIGLSAKDEANAEMIKWLREIEHPKPKQEMPNALASRPLTESNIPQHSGVIEGGKAPSQPGGSDRAEGSGLAAAPPVERIKDIARSYNASASLPPPEDTGELHIDPRAKDIAHAFHALKHDPSDPAVRRSYDALKSETKAQYLHAQASGIHFEPWLGKGQPYENSKEMIQDVREYGHLYYFQGGDLPSDHPLAAVDKETGLSYNDMFRAVHDLFGHAKDGNQFGERGEENAWASHASMYSKDALPAMTAETKGQNAWVNNHPDAAANKTKPGSIYAEQKAALLPEEYHSRLPESHNLPMQHGGLPIPGFVKRIAKEAMGLPNLTAFKAAVNHWQGEAIISTGKLEKMAHDLKKEIPDEKVADAITAYIQSGGDPKVLTHWAGNSNRPEYLKALTLTPDEIASAKKIIDLFEDAKQRAHAAGIDFKDLPNYITQFVKKPKGMYGFGGKVLRDTFNQAKKRQYPNMFEGEQAGVEYHKDARKIVISYLTQLEKVINDREFINKLKDIKTESGEPVLRGKSIAKTMDNGTVVVNPDLPILTAKGERYKPLDQPALRGHAFAGTDETGNAVMVKSDLQVHPEVHNHLKNILGRSWFADQIDSPSNSGLAAVGKGAAHAASEVQKGVKETMFGLLPPSFHLLTVEEHAVAGHHINPLKTFQKVDFSDPKVQGYARDGLMIGPTGKDSELGVGLGGNGGRDWTANALKGIGNVAKGVGLKKVGGAAEWMSDSIYAAKDYLFKQAIPALKIATADAMLPYNRKLYADDIRSGRATDAQVRNRTMQQVNAAFGHLNLAELGRSPTIQAILRTFTLAPDFGESRLRFASSAGAGLFGAKSGRAQLKALATIAITQYTLSRIINKIGDDDWHWKDPFGIYFNGRRYGIRTIPSDFQELIEHPMQFLKGRAAPGPRLALDLYTGTNYRGEETSAADSFRNAVSGAVPVTMQPWVRNTILSGKNNDMQPISPAEQMLSSIGVKINRVSPITDAHQLARDWMKKHGEEFGVKPPAGKYPVSQYQPLRYALEDGDMATAVGEWKRLLASNKKTPEEVYKGFLTTEQKIWTQNQDTERAFKASLSKEDRDVLEKGEKRRRILIERLQSVLKLVSPGTTEKVQLDKNQADLKAAFPKETPAPGTKGAKRMQAARDRLSNQP